MIQYRKATTDDIEDLLRVRMDHIGHNLKNDEDKMKLLDENRKFLIECLVDGSFVEWMALDGDNVIGTGTVTYYCLPPLYDTIRITSKVAFIGNMFTYPTYRRQGIGTKIFTLLLNEAKTYGCGKVNLEASEMGLPIYEKFGFKKSDRMMSYVLED